MSIHVIGPVCVRYDVKAQRHCDLIDGKLRGRSIFMNVQQPSPTGPHYIRLSALKSREAAQPYVSIDSCSFRTYLFNFPYALKLLLNGVSNQTM